jgi:hypothetical protein
MSISPAKTRTLSLKRIESLIRRLNSGDMVTCREAADELLNLPTEQIREVIEYNSNLLDPGKAIIQQVIACLLAIMFVFVMLMHSLPGVGGLLLAFSALLGIFLLNSIWRAVKTRRTCCTTLNRVIEPILNHLDGVSAVPVMADALFNHGESTHALARSVLIHQLPRMESGHAVLLVPAQQHRLNSILSGSDSELIIAILKAYGQIGDASTLEPVARLTRSATDPAVRAAAVECLPLLRSRIAAEEERLARAAIGKTLLRASAPESATADTLLRAATPTPVQETVPEQLLRPQSGS